MRSEVGRLRTVLVHRPGAELDRVAPSTMDELLFDELLWLERAQEEHDAFAAVLADAGAEVLELTDLLAEVVADPDLAAQVVARHATASACGPSAVVAVREALLALPPEALARRLVAGLAADELDGVPGLVAAVGADMLLEPLPNAVFTRDSSAWIGTGAVRGPMRHPARRRETALLAAVHDHHPRFAGAPVWLDSAEGEPHPTSVEGGDLLVLGDDALAVGVSQRTSAPGAERLAHRLLADGSLRRVLVVELPRARATMHLDTVVTQVDRESFLVYPALAAELRVHAVTWQGGGLRVEPREGLADGLAWALGADAVRLLRPELGSVRAEREQWNDANNVLALAPGTVVAYERNVATNAVLADAGIDVRTIPSAELPRGRGGPRCMSCPVVREGA